MNHVYFIKPVDMLGPIKIGRSVSPDGRRATLETWCPFPLEIVAEMAGPKELERRFHAYFLDLHIRHEWFRVSNELQAVMREIADGTFDLGALPPPRKLPTAPRDNSYLTPAWRYRTSVCARLRSLDTTPATRQAIHNFFGCRDPSRIPGDLLLEHQDQLETFIDWLRTNR